mgnify:CR=1 FL=1
MSRRSPPRPPAGRAAAGNPAARRSPPPAITVPPAALALLQQAQQQHRVRDYPAAERLYRQALAHHPRYAEAWFGLGILALQAGAPAMAEDALDHALRLAPDLAEIWLNRGIARQQQGHLAAALADYQAALARRPAYPQALFNLGTLWRSAGQMAAALEAFRQTVLLAPDHAGALLNLGAGFQALEQPRHALPWLLRAGRLAPEATEVRANLAVVLESRGQMAAAARLYRQMLALNPDDASTFLNLGNALRGVGDLPGAERAFAHSRILAPALPGSGWNLGWLRLQRRGPGPERWRLYDERFQGPQPDRRPLPPAVPRWQGEPLIDRRLWLWGEQGLGDEILFSRLVPPVLAAAAHVTLSCAPRLVSLFQRSFPAATVVGEPTEAPQGFPTPAAAADFHSPTGSLARWLCPRLSGFTALPAGGWLRPDPQRLADWQTRLETATPRTEPPRLRIGLGWRSGLITRRRAESYAPLRLWQPLLRLPGVVFVVLQYDPCAPALAEMAATTGAQVLHWPEQDLRNDLENAAALSAALDLVITAPTLVGELAAAVGTPVWRLSPGSDWTALGTAARPWYPEQRLFEPRPGEGLDRVAEQAAAALAALLSSR